MERIKKLFILIFFLNINGMVQSDIIEELLVAVKGIQANMETVMQKVETMENIIKETEKNALSIGDDVKILHNEVKESTKQNIFILEQLGTLKDEVKSVKEEQKANHSIIYLQYIKILEEVKKAGSINAKLDKSVEKYTNHNNLMKEHLDSLKEEVKGVQKDYMRKSEEISLNIEKGGKIASNHSDEILKQIKIFKDEVFSLEEENLKNIEDIGLQLLGSQKLYSDIEYVYYKVPVSNGTTLVEGTVPYTCEKVGMKAVCSGPEGCKRNNNENCVITPLSFDCYNPMYPLSKILCDGRTPRKCEQLEGVFNYMYKRKNGGIYMGECGAVDGSWCVDGNNYTSGEMRKRRKQIYYGYCAKRT